MPRRLTRLRFYQSLPKMPPEMIDALLRRCDELDPQPRIWTWQAVITDRVRIIG